MVNGEMISLGIKKLLIPYISSRIEKKRRTFDELTSIEKRLQHVEKLSQGESGTMENYPHTPTFTVISSEKTDNNDVAVSCIACARSHISTVSALLKESLRFARTEGVSHYEVQRRLQACEEEITALERFDWSPEAVLNSPKTEQEVIHKLQPKLRELRQSISTIFSTEELERVAAIAGNLSTEFRMLVLNMHNTHNNPP